jgi:hypothetical protein
MRTVAETKYQSDTTMRRGNRSTIDNQSLAQSLGVVRLQDVQNLLGQAKTRGGVGAALAGLEVDQESQLLLLGGHDVDDALQHVNEVLDLAGGGIGVLAAGVQIMARR